MRRFKKILILLTTLIVGVMIGGYLFLDTQPRQLFSVSDCKTGCLSAKEFTGLLGSVGVQRFGSLFPSVLLETDKTIAFVHPSPEAKIHYVVVPKRDIKNIGDINEGDESYLVDTFKVLDRLIKDNNLSKYKIITNGPGYQSVAYLHFHLLSNQ